jgi:hypothetical protein
VRLEWLASCFLHAWTRHAEVLEHGLDVAQGEPSLFDLACNCSLQSFSGQLGRRALALTSLNLTPVGLLLSLKLQAIEAHPKFETSMRVGSRQTNSTFAASAMVMASLVVSRKPYQVGFVQYSSIGYHTNHARMMPIILSNNTLTIQLPQPRIMITTRRLERTRG